MMSLDFYNRTDLYTELLLKTRQPDPNTSAAVTPPDLKLSTELQPDKQPLTELPLLQNKRGRVEGEKSDAHRSSETGRSRCAWAQMCRRSPSLPGLKCWRHPADAPRYFYSTGLNFLSHTDESRRDKICSLSPFQLTRASHGPEIP